MAGRDKIYGTQKQYNELKKWLKENQKPIKCSVGFNWFGNKKTPIYEMVLPSEYLYPRNGYDKNERPISNFPESIDKWLLKNCKIEWVISKIKDQYGL
jgi:hypothetical protein